MTSLVEARAATRRFGGFTAVHAVSIAVRPGEVVGLLGANGAGKTTLIRLLLGLLRPSGGGVALFGAPPALETRARVGYVPQTLGLYADLSVEENWRFATAAFRQGGRRLPAVMSAWGATLVGDLPLGIQRQVAFTVALAHQPELMVLDEPTSGVGPLASARLWEQIRSEADRGAGVLVTTHNMEEAEQCDRLEVMAEGSVVARGTATEIVGARTVAEVRCAHWQRAFSVLEKRGLGVQLHGDALRVDSPAGDVAGLLSAAGIESRVADVPANLEDAFVALVTREGGAGGSRPRAPGAR
ncbi:MAG TPA: ABC transporter ATP-binding protein [Acidimicrobiales bacterium]|nr:ABC transporter ATP-binding protein [Acidimicrobiales bacterium]